jgi:hypothetical protein
MELIQGGEGTLSLVLAGHPTASGSATNTTPRVISPTTKWATASAAAQQDTYESGKKRGRFQDKIAAHGHDGKITACRHANLSSIS